MLPMGDNVDYSDDVQMTTKFKKSFDSTFATVVLILLTLFFAFYTC